jgi:hypothetical protein
MGHQTLPKVCLGYSYYQSLWPKRIWVWIWPLTHIKKKPTSNVTNRKMDFFTFLAKTGE